MEIHTSCKFSFLWTTQYLMRIMKVLNSSEHIHKPWYIYTSRFTNEYQTLRHFAVILSKRCQQHLEETEHCILVCRAETHNSIYTVNFPFIPQKLEVKSVKFEGRCNWRTNMKLMCIYLPGKYASFECQTQSLNIPSGRWLTNDRIPLLSQIYFLWISDYLADEERKGLYERSFIIYFLY